MRKFIFFAFALAASALAFVACDNKDQNTPNDPKEQGDPTSKYPASMYDGYYVCDSIFNEKGEKESGNVMFEILNSKQVVFHSHDTATWEIIKDHSFLITFKDSSIIELEGLVEDLEASNTISFYVAQTTSWYVQADYELYMYRLPKIQGEQIAVSEANLLGKWRYGYEENKVWQDGKCIDVTRFNHVGLEILDLQADGKMVIINPPYSYDRTWALNADGLIQLQSTSWYKVELYSNYMHITHFNDAGTDSNEQYYWRLD